MKKRKWWLIPVGMLSVLLLVAALFWQTLILYIAPQMVLAAALKDRISALEEHIAASPIPVLAGGIDSEGRNHIRLQLDTYSELAGSVRYDMEVSLQNSPRRIRADGKAALYNREIDLSLYMDENFAAVSSEGILGGQFYGLTFDTFPEDIRSNKLIAMLIGENVLQSWESRIRMLQAGMGQEFPDIPDMSGIDPEPLAMGILAMDVDVDRTVIDLNGEKQVYYVISFETTGSELLAGMEYLNLDIPIGLDPDEEAEFSFWLKDRKLVKLEISGEEQKLDIYWGDAAVSFLMDEDIYIEYYDGTAFKTCKIHTELTDNGYRETVTYTGTEKIQISYDWTASTGDLMLSVDMKGEHTQLPLILIPVENGFKVTTDDFGALMHLLLGTADSADHPCTMTVTKGEYFETPEFKNFVEWSTEDLLTLLSGFGSLLGLKLP